MLKRTDYPDERIPLKFGYQLTLCIYIVAFILCRFIQNHTSLSIDISMNKILLITFATFLIFGAVFATTLNFDWIKNIKLNKKQKNKSRLILLLIIVVLLLLFNI